MSIRNIEATESGEWKTMRSACGRMASMTMSLDKTIVKCIPSAARRPPQNKTQLNRNS